MRFYFHPFYIPVLCTQRWSTQYTTHQPFHCTTTQLNAGSAITISIFFLANVFIFTCSSKLSFPSTDYIVTVVTTTNELWPKHWHNRYENYAIANNNWWSLLCDIINHQRIPRSLLFGGFHLLLVFSSGRHQLFSGVCQIRPYSERISFAP